MSTAIDKAGVALGAWQHEVEKLATTLFECFEREKAAPTQTSREAYAFAVHEVSSALRLVARRHNEAVAALAAAKET